MSVRAGVFGLFSLLAIVSAPSGDYRPTAGDPLDAAAPPPAVRHRAGMGQGITVVRGGPISEAATDAQYVEPWLAVSPIDPENLVAAAMNLSRSGLRSSVWASGDGGRSWTRSTHGGDAERDFPDGDPMVAFGADGAAYFTTLADGFSVWRSRDGGNRWGEPAHVPGGSYDRQWVAIDKSDGPFHGRIDTAGKIWIKVFGTIVQGVMAIGGSEDGGETYASPRLLLPDPSQEVLHAEPELSNKALGGGRMALDRSSGPFGGRMYLTWIEGFGRALHIVLSSSPDGGRTWTVPVRVDDGGVDSGNGNPAIAVNDDGVVLVTWNDRRADPSDRCFQPYGAVSRDGGLSFAPIGAGRAYPGDRFANGGDTQGLVALPGGNFVAAWIRQVDGDLQVWSSTLRAIPMGRIP